MKTRPPNRPKPKRLVHAALVLEISYGRSIMLGILHYARVRGGWNVVTRATGDFRPTSEVPPDGIIVHGSEPADVDVIRASGLPAVNVSAQMVHCPLPSVLADDAAVGRLVAQHYMERGFAQFAYWGYSGHYYAEERLRGFREELQACGLDCVAWLDAADVGRPSKAPQMKRRREWVRGLAKPVACFCCNDNAARKVCEAALAAGFRVPEDVAIIGVDNDEICCETAALPLSSVDISLHRIGWQAAELLDELMDEARGRRRVAAARTPLLVRPHGVVVRQSSDVLAVLDPEVAAAMRFIQAHAAEGIGVDQVVEATTTSRRMLERRFPMSIGRSIYEEILRVRMTRVRELLASTDMRLVDIVRSTGFSDVAHLSNSFQRMYGMTASAYRRQLQPRP